MQSAIVHKGKNYTACSLTRNGNLSLVVTKNKTQEGRIVVGNTAQEFFDAFQNVIDKAEGESLCRVFFR